VEPLSIDEAFLDVTGSFKLFGTGPEIARQIKRRVVEKERITASVGVAPNKYLAKIASDLEKPDGLVVVEADKIAEFLNSLDISRLWGAGKHTQEMLLKMGIHTIGELAAYPKDVLDKKLGKMGSHFFNLAHGVDNRPVSGADVVKSVSNEHTFIHDILDREILTRTLFQLAEKVGYRLRRKKLRGRTVHLKLRYNNFSTITRNKTLPAPIDSTQKIFNIISSLFESNYQKGRRVRLLGVGISGFDKFPGEQLTLFDQKDESKKELDKLQDILTDRFGKKIITRAESMRYPKESS